MRSTHRRARAHNHAANHKNCSVTVKVTMNRIPYWSLGGGFLIVTVSTGFRAPLCPSLCSQNYNAADDDDDDDDHAFRRQQALQHGHLRQHQSIRYRYRHAIRPHSPSTTSFPAAAAAAGTIIAIWRRHPSNASKPKGSTFPASAQPFRYAIRYDYKHRIEDDWLHIPCSCSILAAAGAPSPPLHTNEQQLLPVDTAAYSSCHPAPPPPPPPLPPPPTASSQASLVIDAVTATSSTDAKELAGARRKHQCSVWARCFAMSTPSSCTRMRRALRHRSAWVTPHRDLVLPTRPGQRARRWRHRHARLCRPAKP